MTALTPKQWLYTALFAVLGYCLGQMLGFATGAFALMWWIILPLLIIQLIGEGLVRGIWWSLKRVWRAARGLPPPPAVEPAPAKRIFPPYKYAILGGFIAGFAHFWFGEDGQTLWGIMS